MYDALQHKKRMQVCGVEDKERIPFEEEEVTRFSVSKPVVVLRKIEEAHAQPMFSSDKLKCKLDGHLFSSLYVQSVHKAMGYNEKKYSQLLPNPNYFLNDLVHMSDNAFMKDDIIAMEVKICESLNYKFSIAHAFQFLERFTEVAIVSVKGHRLKRRVKYLARYGMERYHLNVKVLQYCPSLLAAGALLAALKLTSHRWNSLCECVSGYSESKLLTSVSQIGEQPIFVQIKKAVMNFNSPSHQAIIFKYKKANRGSVSALRKKEKRPSSRAR